MIDLQTLTGHGRTTQSAQDAITSLLYAPLSCTYSHISKLNRRNIETSPWPHSDTLFLLITLAVLAVLHVAFDNSTITVRTGCHPRRVVHQIFACRQMPRSSRTPSSNLRLPSTVPTTTTFSSSPPLQPHPLPPILPLTTPPHLRPTLTRTPMTSRKTSRCSTNCVAACART